MKFNRNFKVQYKSEKLGIKSENRYLLYRIEPSELPFFKRLFCNKWQYVYNCVYTYHTKSSTCIHSPEDLIGMLFDYNEAVEFIKSHQTFGELADFLNKIAKEAKEHYDKISEPYKEWGF